jgi:hypothetical protein
VRVGSLELSYDLSPADWIVDCIHNFAVDVSSIIPESFEANARLFHPVIRIEHGEQVAVRWTEIAATRGRTTHPEMQWANISGVWEHLGERVVTPVSAKTDSSTCLVRRDLTLLPHHRRRQSVGDHHTVELDPH